MPREYTYGPYPSRRLGLSLGVNVLPTTKTCTFDCVYCEIGRTEKLVDSDFRLSLPPSRNFEKELRDILKFFPHLDSITFGYNGEPTLNDNLIDFYEIAFKVRENLQWKKDPPLITIFTNSTTLNSREVRKTLANFDLVLAKLDAATQEDFIRTNRPHPNLPEISFIIKDLSILSQEMGSNSLTLQCLIYNSYREDFVPNSNQVNIKKLAIAINKIKPNAVQIYSLGRIPAEYFVYSIDNVQKEKISTIFKKIIKDPSINITFY